MKWYARDPHRAIEGMTGLSLQDCGAYNLLLDHSYARDGNLPDESRLICCMLRVHGNAWRAIRSRLIEAGKIKIQDGKIIPNGVENTLRSARNFSEKQRERVAKRWNDTRKSSGKRLETPQKRFGNAPEKSKNPNENNETQIPLTNTYTYTNTYTPLNPPNGGVEENSKEKKMEGDGDKVIPFVKVLNRPSNTSKPAGVEQAKQAAQMILS